MKILVYNIRTHSQALFSHKHVHTYNLAQNFAQTCTHTTHIHHTSCDQTPTDTPDDSEEEEAVAEDGEDDHDGVEEPQHHHHIPGHRQAKHSHIYKCRHRPTTT